MEFNTKLPVYTQIENLIILDILNGKYLANDKLPSVRELARDLIVNTNTVLKSYKNLENLGIIETKRGLGYFVTTNENILDMLKKQEINAIVITFIQNMKKIGHDKNKTLAEIERMWDNVKNI